MKEVEKQGIGEVGLESVNFFVMENDIFVYTSFVVLNCIE